MFKSISSLYSRSTVILISAALLVSISLLGCAASAPGTDGDKITSESALQLPSSPGDLGLDQLASMHYREGRYAESVACYEQWLKAKPDDASAWYNYACTLTLLGRHELAVKALAAAAEAGFSNIRHAERDSDLVVLHELPGYSETLETIRANNEQNLLDPEVVHYLRQERLGRYALHLPDSVSADAKLPVILYLHGRTRTLNTAAFFAEAMTEYGIAVIIPEAPYALDGDRGGFEYWPVDPSAASEIEGVSAAVLASSLTAEAYPHVLNDAARRAPLDLDRVVAVGFSMGAAETYVALSKIPSSLAGAVVISGFMPRYLRGPEHFEASGESVLPVLLLHGEDDRPENAELGRSILTEAGCSAEVTLYPDTGHEITDEMLEDVVRWVTRLLNH
jgi:predicted esterase